MLVLSFDSIYGRASTIFKPRSSPHPDELTCTAHAAVGGSSSPASSSHTEAKSTRLCLRAQSAPTSRSLNAARAPTTASSRASSVPWYCCQCSSRRCWRGMSRRTGAGARVLAAPVVTRVQLSGATQTATVRLRTAIGVSEPFGSFSLHTSTNRDTTDTQPSRRSAMMTEGGRQVRARVLISRYFFSAKNALARPAASENSASS